MEHVVLGNGGMANAIKDALFQMHNINAVMIKPGSLQEAFAVVDKATIVWNCIGHGSVTTPESQKLIDANYGYKTLLDKIAYKQVYFSSYYCYDRRLSQNPYVKLNLLAEANCRRSIGVRVTNLCHRKGRDGVMQKLINSYLTLNEPSGTLNPIYPCWSDDIARLLVNDLEYIEGQNGVFCVMNKRNYTTPYLLLKEIAKFFITKKKIKRLNLDHAHPINGLKIVAESDNTPTFFVGNSAKTNDEMINYYLNELVKNEATFQESLDNRLE